MHVTWTFEEARHCDAASSNVGRKNASHKRSTAGNMGCATSSEAGGSATLPAAPSAARRPAPTFRMIPDRYETIGASASELLRWSIRLSK
jgi:hypothetical protein